MRAIFSAACTILLAGCVNGIPPKDGWEPPPPPKPCEIPVIVDGEKRGCIPRSGW